MKKIIKGKKYDTETAKQVGRWSNTFDWYDFGYCSESLYKKKTGEYFIFGEGGPMSRYSVSTGTNSRSGGFQIIPVSEEEAKEWAEDHLDADNYEKIFGEVEE